VSIVTFVAGYGLESQQQEAMLALPVLSSELRNLGIDSFRPRYPRMLSGLGGFCCPFIHDSVGHLSTSPLKTLARKGDPCGL
jgi:hypothetical protein